MYVVYRTSASNQKPLNLIGAPGTFTVKWYDAINGGDFVDGSVKVVTGGGSVDLGNPPTNATGPWAVIVSKNTFTGENEIRKNFKINLYPNPTTYGVNFSERIDADFYTVAGQKVLSVINSKTADVSSLSKGFYQVKVNNGSSYKLIVN